MNPFNFFALISWFNWQTNELLEQLKYVGMTPAQRAAQQAREDAEDKRIRAQDNAFYAKALIITIPLIVLIGLFLLLTLR